MLLLQELIVTLVPLPYVFMVLRSMISLIADVLVILDLQVIDVIDVLIIYVRMVVHQQALILVIPVIV